MNLSSLCGLQPDRLFSNKNAMAQNLGEWIVKLFELPPGAKFDLPTWNGLLEKAVRRIFSLDLADFSSEETVTQWKSGSRQYLEYIYRTNSNVDRELW